MTYLVLATGLNLECNTLARALEEAGRCARNGYTATVWQKTHVVRPGTPNVEEAQ